MEFLTLGSLRELMWDMGLRPDRSLGQNFLINLGVVEAIAEAGGDAEVAIDIGAGPGILTLPLSGLYPRVIAIEIDSDMVALLRRVTGDTPGVEIVAEDARTIDWCGMFRELEISSSPVIFGNLPYYAAAPILTHFLESGVPWRRAVFMFQREVAERLTAEPADKAYGILTLAVRYYADVKALRRVSPGSFFPPPEVTSSVVALTPRRTTPGADFDDFILLVRAGFGQRRKTVRNALIGSPELGLDRDAVDFILEEAGVDPRARAETLGLDVFEAMASVMGSEQLQGDEMP